MRDKPHTLTSAQFTDRYRITFNATTENPEKRYMEYRHVKQAIGRAAYKARGGFVTRSADVKAAKAVLKSDAFLKSCRGMQSGQFQYTAWAKAREVYDDRCDRYLKGELQ